MNFAKVNKIIIVCLGELWFMYELHAFLWDDINFITDIHVKHDNTPVSTQMILSEILEVILYESTRVLLKWMLCVLINRVNNSLTIRLRFIFRNFHYFIWNWKMNEQNQASSSSSIKEDTATKCNKWIQNPTFDN